MMVYLTGDLHGEIDFPKINRIPSNCDKLIILGDFGVIFEPDETEMERNLLNRLEKLEIPILFIDGNHENFTRLNAFPRENKFGNEVGIIRNNIFHLLRGNIYNVDDNKIFVMGGGLSIDKKYRTENISWWKEEEPSREEIENAFNSLEAVNNKVDYIFTHSIPSKLKSYLKGSFIENGFYDSKGSSHSYTERFLDELLNIEFKIWYFGHYHTNIMIEDETYGKFVGLYEELVPLGYFDRLIGQYNFDWIYI